MSIEYVTSKKYEAIGALAAAIVIAILAPLVYIWAWNQLFSSVLTIDFTFLNWLAVAVFQNLFKNATNVKKTA